MLMGTEKWKGVSRSILRDHEVNRTVVLTRNIFNKV